MGVWKASPVQRAASLVRHSLEEQSVKFCFCGLLPLFANKSINSFNTGSVPSSGVLHHGDIG